MTYISRSSDFSSFIFCSEKHFSFIGKAQFRRAALSCDSSYLFCQKFLYGDSMTKQGIFPGNPQRKVKKYLRVGSKQIGMVER